MKHIAVLAAAAALASLAGLSPAVAQEGREHSYALDDGTVHGNPGEMFKHLRTRDNGLAVGNPKDIVNAYPDAYENVGDLVGQSRERGAAE